MRGISYKKLLIGIIICIIIISFLLLLNKKQEVKLDKDSVVQVSAYDSRVQAYGVVSKNTLEIMRRKQNISATAIGALGRTVSIGLMMSQMFEDVGDKLTIEIDGDGPVDKVVVNANKDAMVNGYIENPQIEVLLNDKGNLDVSSAIGIGSIHVRQRDGSKVRTVSIPIVSGEVGEDFAYFFTNEKNIPSAVAVGELIDRDLSVKQSGGFIITLTSDVNEIEISEIENNLYNLGPLSTALDNGLSIEEILEKVLGKIKIIQRKEVSNTDYI